MSDHCRVETVFSIITGQSKRSSHSRKLNAIVLDNAAFQAQFRILYKWLSGLIDEYDVYGLLVSA